MRHLKIYIDEDNDPQLYLAYSDYIERRGANPNNSGFDIILNDKITLAAPVMFDDITTHKMNQTAFIDNKIRAVLYDHLLGGAEIPFLVEPRSSISKTPLRMSNGHGIIDIGYRGPIITAVDLIGSHDTNITDVINHYYEHNTKLFQIVAPDLQPFTASLHDIKELNMHTTRGQGGFGSTNATS